MEGTPFGRYRLIELLGRGGMGEVWRAFDPATNRVVAVKVLPANLANDPQFEQRFRREAFAAAGLSNPHVVPIHYFGEIDGRLYVDMRLIDGRDLQSILAHGPPLEPARAVGIIGQIASALHAAHRIGLVHRDVKPSNILVDDEDFAYLIDFGIARAAGETGLTGTGNVIGTWAYLAPERLTSGQTDPRADIYALACVLHECLTGSQPFPGNSVEQITAHLTSPPPRPSVLQDTVPTAMDAVVAKGMAKNPDERYSTVSEMANAARAAITAPTTRPASMPPPEPLRPTEHRAELPTRPGAPLSHQEVAAGGVSPFVPTQHRPGSDPNLWGQVPHGAGQTAPKKFSRKRAAILGVASVIAVLIAVAAIVVSNQGDSSPATTTGGTSTSQTSTALPNTGPFCERCMSYFIDPGTGAAEPLVFGNGKWTRNTEYDATCSVGGTSHEKNSGEFPLPQPAQDPITLLTGHGRSEGTGSACVGGDYDQKFFRTGD